MLLIPTDSYFVDTEDIFEHIPNILQIEKNKTNLILCRALEYILKQEFQVSLKSWTKQIFIWAKLKT